MSSYLAFQSLQSYGPCLQESADKEDELFDLTDGFSVAALKVRPHYPLTLCIQGTKIFEYCTCPVTYNFHSSCKHMHMSFKSVCHK